MFETTVGAIVAAIVGITAALILLLPSRVLWHPLFRKPAKPQLPKAAPIQVEAQRLTEERRALTTAWRKEARERELGLHWVPVIEHETERLAQLIVDGITTRGSAIHRLCALVRKHTPPPTVGQCLDHIARRQAAFVRSMQQRATEPQA